MPHPPPQTPGSHPPPPHPHPPLELCGTGGTSGSVAPLGGGGHHRRGCGAVQGPSGAPPPPRGRDATPSAEAHAPRWGKGHRGSGLPPPPHRPPRPTAPRAQRVGQAFEVTPPPPPPRGMRRWSGGVGHRPTAAGQRSQTTRPLSPSAPQRQRPPFAVMPPPPPSPKFQWTCTGPSARARGEGGGGGVPQPLVMTPPPPDARIILRRVSWGPLGRPLHGPSPGLRDRPFLRADAGVSSLGSRHHGPPQSPPHTLPPNSCAAAVAAVVKARWEGAGSGQGGP